MTYFKIVTLNYSTFHYAVKKLENPLMDKFHYDDVWTISPPSKMDGDVLSICEDDAYFNTWDDEPSGVGAGNWPRYAIGYGLYQLTRPGVDYQKMLYFYMPYQGGFWYGNGPDLRLYYGTDFTGSNCVNGFQQITEDYETRYCAFCISGTSVFGFTHPTDYIATTNYSTIKNYWTDNILTIGVTSSSTTPPLTNLYEIEAQNYAQATCSIPIAATLISTFSLSANGEYDIQKYLGPGGTQVFFPVGTQLYLQIKANFKNGEYIDQNKCITINDTPRGMLKVQIRGDIKDYNATVINYEIKIYQ